MPGKILFDIPPKMGNPRNSEGDFVTLPSGDILFVYARFTGGTQDDAAADLYAMRSRDGGRTFEEAGLLLSCEQDEAKNIMSVTLLPMQNGDTGLFYLIRKSGTLMRLVLRRSVDEGKSWSEPVYCTNQEGFFVINNDRVTRLASGRLIAPVALHRKTADVYDARSEALFFLSDDDGYTWRAAPGKCVMPYVSISGSGLQEPGVIELTPGVLWAWARTDLGRQYEMISVDNGEHFTAAQPSRFTGPLSPLSMKRLAGGEILAVWNPVPLYNGRSDQNSAGAWTGGRTPLVMAISKDNGAHFSAPITLEDDPEYGYCYCAIHDVGDAVLLSYCAGGTQDGNCLARTRVRRIEKDEWMKE